MAITERQARKRDAPKIHDIHANIFSIHTVRAIIAWRITVICYYSTPNHHEKYSKEYYESDLVFGHVFVVIKREKKKEKLATFKYQHVTWPDVEYYQWKTVERWLFPNQLCLQKQIKTKSKLHPDKYSNNLRQKTLSVKNNTLHAKLSLTMPYFQ